MTAKETLTTLIALEDKSTEREALSGAEVKSAEMR